MKQLKQPELCPQTRDKSAVFPDCVRALSIAVLFAAAVSCKRAETPAVPASAESVAPQNATGSIPPSARSAITSVAPPGSTVPAAAPDSAPDREQPKIDPASRRLVDIITRTDQTGPMTPEQITQWKESVQQLVQAGPQSVPAILEYLKKNQDVEFGAAGKESLGYTSARRAMFDALAQIGGPEGSAALVTVLQDSADPREISLLAEKLAKLSPDEHRAEILQATRDVLGMASGGKLPADTDVGPLFEVLQKYGDQSVVSDLEKSSSQWKYYSTMALANLPDGAGVPSLVKMVEENSPNKLTALQMLGQVAHQYPEARTALLEQARANKIAPNAWPYLIDSLAGREFGYLNSETDTTRASVAAVELKTTSIRFGNQNYYTAPAPANPEFVQSRMAIIDELKAVTTDPAGLAALEQARNELSNRLPRQP